MAYSPCGQLCHNTPGSYACGCIPGHQLYNGTDCRVRGEFQYPKDSLFPALFLAVIIDKKDCRLFTLRSSIRDDFVLSIKKLLL